MEEVSLPTLKAKASITHLKVSATPSSRHITRAQLARFRPASRTRRVLSPAAPAKLSRSTWLSAALPWTWICPATATSDCLCVCIRHILNQPISKVTAVNRRRVPAAEAVAPPAWRVSSAVAVPKVGDIMVSAAPTTDHHVHRTLRHLSLNEGTIF